MAGRYEANVGRDKWTVDLQGSSLTWLGGEDGPIHQTKEQFVETSRLQALVRGCGVVVMGLPERKLSIMLSPEGTLAIKDWLGASLLRRWAAKSVQAEWVFNLVLGVLFMTTGFGKPSDMVATGGGAVFSLVGIAAKVSPSRNVYLLRALGWAVLVVAFLVGVTTEGQPAWTLLVCLFGALGASRAFRLYGYFEPDGDRSAPSARD